MQLQPPRPTNQHKRDAVGVHATAAHKSDPLLRGFQTHGAAGTAPQFPSECTEERTL